MPFCKNKKCILLVKIIQGSSWVEIILFLLFFWRPSLPSALTFPVVINLVESLFVSLANEGGSWIIQDQESEKHITRPWQKSASDFRNIVIFCSIPAELMACLSLVGSDPLKLLCVNPWYTHQTIGVLSPSSPWLLFKLVQGSEFVRSVERNLKSSGSHYFEQIYWIFPGNLC